MDNIIDTAELVLIECYRSVTHTWARDQWSQWTKRQSWLKPSAWWTRAVAAVWPWLTTTADWSAPRPARTWVYVVLASVVLNMGVLIAWLCSCSFATRHCTPSITWQFSSFWLTFAPNKSTLNHRPLPSLNATVLARLLACWLLLSKSLCTSVSQRIQC